MWSTTVKNSDSVELCEALQLRTVAVWSCVKYYSLEQCHYGPVIYLCFCPQRVMRGNLQSVIWSSYSCCFFVVSLTRWTTTDWKKNILFIHFFLIARANIKRNSHNHQTIFWYLSIYERWLPSWASMQRLFYAIVLFAEFKQWLWHETPILIFNNLT